MVDGWWLVMTKKAAPPPPVSQSMRLIVNVFTIKFIIEAPGSGESILKSRSYCVGGRGAASLRVHEFLVILSFDLESPWDVLESPDKFSILTRSGMSTVISYFTLYLDLFWLRGQVCFGWVFRDPMTVLRQRGGIVVSLSQTVVGSIPSFLCTLTVSVLHSFPNIQEPMGRLGQDWPWSVTMKLFLQVAFVQEAVTSFSLQNVFFSFFSWKCVKQGCDYYCYPLFSVIKLLFSHMRGLFYSFLCSLVQLIHI